MNSLTVKKNKTNRNKNNRLEGLILSFELDYFFRCALWKALPLISTFYVILMMVPCEPRPNLAHGKKRAFKNG